MTLNSSNEFQDQVIAQFGLQEGDDSWIDQLRHAEQSDALGSLGRFKLIEEVARGGQGVVYRAIDPDISREVAIKVVSAGNMASAARLSRVKRELEAIVKLDHPFVVTLYGAEWINGVPALIMKWIDGVPFDEWAKEATIWGQKPSAPRTHQQLLDIMISICEGIQHAHQRGVIHRDLKPSNVLIDGDDRPQILDFGLAKLEQENEESNLTRDGEFLGTAQYAAPEQYLHGASAVDVRSDVFSLGAMLLETVANGSRPAGHRDSGWTQALLPTIKNRNWRAVLRKSTTIDPKDRYQSIETFAQDLMALRQNGPIMARNQTASEKIINTARRHPRSVGAGLVFSVIILSLGIMMTHLYRQAKQESAKTLAALQLFEQALSPSKASLPGTTQTVAQVFANMSKQLRESSGLPCDVRAHAHNVIAKLYAVSGMWQDVAIEAWAAEQSIRELNDPLHPELAQALKARGNAAAVRQDPKSVELHQRSVAILTRLHGVRSFEVSAGKIALAYALWQCNRGTRPDIESILREGIAIHLELGGQESELGIAFWLLGDFLAQDGRINEAIVNLYKASSALATQLGVGTYHWGLAVESLANLLFSLNRDEEANTVLDQAIAECISAKQPFAHASFLWMRGKHWHTKEQFSLAMDAYRRSIEIRAGAFPIIDSATEILASPFLNHWHRLLRTEGDSTFQPIPSAIEYCQALAKSGESGQAIQILDMALNYLDSVENDTTSMLALSIRIERATSLVRASRFDSAESELLAVQRDIIGTSAPENLRLAYDQAMAELTTAINKPN